MRCLSLGIFLWVALVFPGSSGGQLLDAIVARVDTEVVTWSRVVQERELRRIGGAPAAELAPEKIRENLVRRHLLVAEARKLRLEVSAAEARDDVEFLVRVAGRESFWEWARTLGLDRSQLEERAARQVLVHRYQQLRREMTFVPESEVRAFFFQQSPTRGRTSLAEMRDEIRTQLAEQKYRKELELWIRKQVAEGRVERLPLPETPAH